jgi:hypothetical protein
MKRVYETGWIVSGIFFLTINDRMNFILYWNQTRLIQLLNIILDNRDSPAPYYEQPQTVFVQ